MLAAVLHKQAPLCSHSLNICDIGINDPEGYELQVEVKACGLCRTDLHIIEGDLPAPRLPLVPGHQIVGNIIKLGAGCSRFQVGDRVGIAWLRHTCGYCNFCSGNQENLCSESRYTGYHEHGGYAELCNIHENFAYKIPSEFEDTTAAPLLCAGIIGYRALKRANLPVNGRLAILGFGSSAHITIQLALSLNCEIFVMTRGESHRQLALEMGACWAGNTFEHPPKAVDSAIIFAPSGDLIPIALGSVRQGGTVVCAGIHMSDIPSMKYQDSIFHEKDLRTVEANTRLDGEELFAIATKFSIHPRVTVFSLNQINEALLELKHDKIDGTAVIKF